MAKAVSAPLTEASISWRRMLAGIPRRNAAVSVEASDHALTVTVPLTRPRWAVPPVTWLIPLPTQRRFALDALGRDVWDWCDGERSVEEVIDALADKYALSFHEARVAVVSYLSKLLRCGLLAIEQPADMPYSW